MIICRSIIAGLAIAFVGQPLAAQADSAASRSSKIPTDRVAVPNLTEAIGGRFAGVTMLRSDGLSSTGGVLRMRGWRSLIFSNEPAVEIDGVLLSVQPTPDLAPGMNGARLPVVSLLDLLDPDDIERIEVEPGLATGIGRGAGLANGLVRITTKRGGPGTRFSVGSEWGVSSTSLDFGFPSYFVTGADGALSGQGCLLSAQAVGQCEPGQILRRNGATDPLVRQTGTGTHGRMRVEVRGSSGRLRYAASSRWSSGYGALALPPGERSRLETAIGDWTARVARPDRLGELFGRAALDVDLGRGLSITLIGNVARQRALTPAPVRMPSSGGTILANALVDPRYPDSAAWFLGTALLPGDLYRRASDRELLRQVVGAGVTWEPNRNFRSWLRVAGVWDRHAQRQAIADTFPSVGGQARPFADSLSYRDDQVQVELGLRHAVDLGPVRFAIAPMYQVRDRRPSRFFGQAGGEPNPSRPFEDSYRLTGGVLRTELTTRDERVGVGGTVRRDEARRFERWEEPTWSYSMRGWWTGMVSGHAAYGVTRRRADPDGPLPTSLLLVRADDLVDPLKPERIRELEVGLRVRDRDERWEVGATGFGQRTTDGWGTRITPPTGGLVPVIDNVGAEITNTGIEVDVTAWLTRGATWQVRGGVVGSLLSSTLESNGIGIPATSLLGYCSFEEHEPFARCGRPMPNVVDLNGDGLLSSAEYQAGGITPYQSRGSSIPTRTAGVWFDATRAFRVGNVSLLGHFDYVGGHWSESAIASAQCSFFWRCRYANDPSSSIEQQAAVFTEWGMYFLRDASFGRMRELALSWQTSGGLARWLGADRVSLSLTARNLFTISGFQYWDPEVRHRATEHAPFDQDATPLPRTFTIKLGVEW